VARPNKQHEIGIWLKGLLAAGRRKAEDVLAAANQTGYSERSLRSVKAELGIISEQENEVWYWRDPSIEQAKPASQDRLDILTHKVDEAIRLSKPTVPIAPGAASLVWRSVPDQVEHKPIGILGRKSRAIDIRDPEVQAQLAQVREAADRFDAVQGVVASPDPFKLLDSANADEIDRMMLLVHEQLAELETRGKGKLKYRKAWEVTKQIEKQVTGREWSTKQGKWIDVPAVQTEELKYISDVPVEGAKSVDVSDGYDSGEDVTLEMGKWETWIDRAKERQQVFLKPDSVAAES